MTVSRKILYCFLLSALLSAGIAALAFAGIFGNYRGIVGESGEMFLLVTVFLTLFLTFFFCFNLRRDSVHEADKKSLKVSPDAGTDIMSADAVQVEVVTGLGGSFFMFRQPFAFIPGNPELLQEAESQKPGISGEVVFEKNGIHYINSDVFADDEKKDEFDNNFAKLVESVVNNKEFEVI